MATGKAIRTDDGSGLNIATVTFTEDAVTKHAQQMVLVDATTPTQKLSVGSNGAVQTQAVGNGAILAGQQAVTATAAALASNACRKVNVKALFGNTIPVYIGASGVTTGNGYELQPGDSIPLDVTNTNLIFVIASTTGASVTWVATN